MRAKEYLEQIGKFQKNISRKKKEIEEIIKLRTEIKDECYMEKLDLLEHKLQKEILEYVEAKHRIINEIFELSNSKHMDILYERYVDMKSLKEIALDDNYSYEHVKSLHGHALSAFDNKILKKYTQDKVI